MIAAHLGSADCEEWIELGETSLKRGNPQEALICFNEGGVKRSFILLLSFSILTEQPLNLSRYKRLVDLYVLASRKDPTNVDILMTKASIYENLKQQKKKMEVYENILKVNVNLCTDCFLTFLFPCIIQ